jgi:alkylation response protein AidB-like acyl-CoA dehydrogenase
MNLLLSAEQTLLRDTARDFVQRTVARSPVREVEAGSDGYDAAAWAQMGHLGWTGLLVAEAASGAGHRSLELGLVLEELAGGPVIVPLIPSAVLAAVALEGASGTSPLGTWLEAIAGGEVIATVAVLEPGFRDEWQKPRTRLDGDAGVRLLTGRKILVPFAGASSVIVASAVSDAGLALVVVDTRASGVGMRRQDDAGGEPVFEVRFDGVAVNPESVIAEGEAASRLLDRVLQHGALLSTAHAVGLAQRALELSVEHAKTRVQFGRPIGAFQAVAHRCVDLACDVEACRYAWYQAAWKLDADAEAAFEIAAAKAYATEALRRVFLNAHQIHGAMGFSMEHDLQLFARRAKTFELSFGSAPFHRERIASMMGMAPAEGPGSR